MTWTNQVGDIVVEVEADNYQAIRPKDAGELIEELLRFLENNEDESNPDLDELRIAAEEYFEATYLF